MKKTSFFLLFLTCFAGVSQETNIPEELNLIFEYVKEKDYPEVFDEPFQVRPVDWIITDIGNDGITEIFLQTFPHYRQSPSISIYQIHEGDSVSRITEGLAPGPLVPINPEDDYFNPHATGSAMDMHIEEANEQKMRKFTEIALQNGFSPVIYKDFVHADHRKGSQIFLDMSHLEYSGDRSCKNFQFSKPEAIIAGNIKGKNDKFFCALVGNEIYCYSIKGFTENRWIEKELTIVDKPSDFDSFLLEDGLIKYLNQNGKKKRFKI